jgi:uncharacterized protein YhjY with autotransporter beta-barrel domain
MAAVQKSSQNEYWARPNGTAGCPGVVTSAPDPARHAAKSPVLSGIACFARRAFAAVATGAALLAGIAAAPSVNAADTFANSGCPACHTVGGARINGANSPNVLTSANTRHAMGVNFAVKNPTEIAADLQATYAGLLSQTNAVTYGTSGNAITVTSLVIDAPNAVITTTALVGANGGATQGTVTAGTANSLDISYSHTAGNCSGDTVTLIGTGFADTTNRTVNITVNPPTLTTSANSPSLAYNSATFANIALVTSGPYSGATITTGLSPNVGTLQVSGTNIQYRASSSAYAGTVTFSYQTTGPCSTTSNISTVTLSVGLPPAPAGANVGSAGARQPVAFNTPQNFVLPVTGIFSQVNVTNGANGTVATPAANTSTVTYTPNTGYIGADSFTYTVTGPGGTSASYTVFVDVITPAAPTVSNVVVNNVAYQTATPIALTVGGVFTQVNVVSGPTHGTAPTPAANTSTITYTPASGYIGSDSITYSATGPGGTSAVNATVSITVLAPPAPGAGNFNQNVAYQTATAVTIPVTGIFNQVTVLTAPTHGTAPTPAANASTVTYTPATGYIGADSFTYQVSGPGGTSATFTVNITVNAPGAPVAGNRTATVAYNTATAIDLTANITGFVSSIAVVGGSVTNGTTSVAGNIVTFTPTTGYFGPATFQYTATAPGGAVSGAGVVSITVSTLPPGASPAAMTVPVNSSGTLNLAPFITGTAITGIVITTAPTKGTAVVSGTSVTYTPMSGFFGTDTFAYSAIGNAPPNSAPALVTVTVSGRPDPMADATVMGAVRNQNETARRFSRSQLSNFQSRMESLRRNGGAGGGSASGAARDAFAVNNDRNAPVALDHAAPRAQPFPDPDSPRPLGDSGNDGQTATPVRLAGLNTNPGGADPAAGALGVPPGLMTLLAAAQNRAVNLGAAAGAGDLPGPNAGGLAFWIGGDVRFGTRDNAGAQNTTFKSDGISAGVDRRFSDQLILGVGVGFGRDKAAIGTDGSVSKATGTSAALYGSYQPTANTFVDALLGYGIINFDGQRYVAPLNSMAAISRGGSQVFGSLATGYEFRDNGILLSPYGRIDFSIDQLKQASETGVGAFSLTYFDQTSRTLRTALGVRLESSHETDFGLATPRVRFEYQHGFEGGAGAQIAYTDQINAQRYSSTASGIDRNSIVLGLGSDFVLRNGLTIGVDYQLLRSFSQETSHGIRFRLKKELDGKGSSGGPLLPSIESSMPPLGIRVNAGYTYDDNITRGRDEADKRSDQSYSADVSKGWFFPLTEHSRALLALSGGGEKFLTYAGLNRLFGTVIGELQYRPSGEFSAPTFAVFSRLTGEAYQSDLRDGNRLAVGVSVRQSLTDRISAFGALTHTERSARSMVFVGRENSARLNLDYSLASNSTFYVTGEVRRGDTVSTGRATLASLDIAKWIALDDAYTDGITAYRLEARTLLGTIGYNLPFGPRDSLDLSWRRAQATSVESSFYGKSRYVTDQFSLVYLLSF